MHTVTIEQLYTWLEEVKDPEIPVLSLVDLGIITNVQVNNDSIYIEMTPTFVGCPALDFMKEEIESTLKKYISHTIHISVNFREPWSSDKISEKGKTALKNFGIAPPGTSALICDLDILEHTPCPRCEGTDTSLKNPFGPTLCRAIHYCHTCQEAFEQFKPV